MDVPLHDIDGPVHVSDVGMRLIDALRTPTTDSQGDSPSEASAARQ